MTAGAADPTDPALFYGELAPFEEFDQFVEFDSYAPVPDDWVVMIADVEGSTRAIEQGRYKDVNMVGAASIIAVLNVCGDIEVPFVFGGDGGTVVVPASLRDAAAAALGRLQAASRSIFGVLLRAGAYPVADLRATGADVRVRKFRLSPGNHLAMFAGGGLEMCDRLLKSAASDDPCRVAAPAGGDPPDLGGLSCRWEPLTPKNGQMITLMVQGTDRDPEAERGALVRALSDIADILGHDLRDSAPASAHSMRFRWPPRGLGLEARATAGRGGFALRLLAVLASSLVQYWCERFDRRAGPYDAPVYRAELRANTDFRKYDGMLRTVLDVGPREAAMIEDYLEREYRAGRLVYGTHISESALMTCLVFSLANGEHLHFIDGAGGGFAKAAAAFKARIARRGDRLAGADSGW